MKSAAIPHHARSGPRLEPIEGLAEVSDEVVGILTPYGDAQKAWRDPRLRQMLLRVLPMARRRGVGDDRVDAPEARGATCEFEVVHERFPGRTSAFDLEGEHPAGRRELPPREVVLRVARETGVEDPRHARVLLQEAGDR